MGGASSSSSSSIQSGEAYIAQQLSQSCNITCSNIASGISVDIINSIIGGSINLTQSCQVDANCLISGSSDASSDILFKARNSSNAKDVGGLPSGSLFNFDQASSISRQDIKQKIVQSTTSTCKLASLNQLTDVSILAANSNIGGSINIAQTGSTAGSCQLSNNLSASATATALASNTAQSGKDKKGEKGGPLVFILGFVVIMIVVFIIAKVYTGQRDDSVLQSKTELAAQARAFAGCAGKQVIDVTTGKAVLDPATNRPICKPENISIDTKSFSSKPPMIKNNIEPIKPLELFPSPSANNIATPKNMDFLFKTPRK
jgi:hypothetical protein